MRLLPSSSSHPGSDSCAQLFLPGAASCCPLLTAPTTRGHIGISGDICDDQDWDGQGRVCWHLVVKARDLLTWGHKQLRQGSAAPGAVALIPRSPGRRPSWERDRGVWAAVSGAWGPEPESGLDTTVPLAM